MGVGFRQIFLKVSELSKDLEKLFGDNVSNEKSTFVACADNMLDELNNELANYRGRCEQYCLNKLAGVRDTEIKNISNAYERALLSAIDALKNISRIYQHRSDKKHRHYVENANTQEERIVVAMSGEELETRMKKIFGNNFYQLLDDNRILYCSYKRLCEMVGLTKRNQQASESAIPKGETYYRELQSLWKKICDIVDADGVSGRSVDVDG